MKIHVVLTDKAISWIKVCRKKWFFGQAYLHEKSCAQGGQ